ncbi:MAG TPA: HAD family hydrolase [Anaerolineales bacterium]|jgi:putative hydrolase of the HAD superfamily
MRNNCFQAILFDWGDTVMHDDPALTTPMLTWPQVRAVDGVHGLLDYLHTNGCRMVLATSAAISNEKEIRGALARVYLDQYFDKIYCFDSTGLKKPSAAFYQYILNDLKLKPEQVLMVGDSFENDVQASNQIGIPAVWYNPRSAESRTGEMLFTVHSMAELLAWFQGL